MASHAARALVRLDHQNGEACAWEDVLRNIDIAIQTGKPEIVLTGTEPTASPQLIKAIRRCSDQGCRVTLETGGHLLSDPKRLERLAQAGLTMLGIRLLGPDLAVHDSLSHPGSFEIATAALLAALDVEGVRGSVRIPLRASTVPHLGPTIHTAARLGAREVVVVCPNDTEMSPMHRMQAIDLAWHAASSAGVVLDVTGLDATAEPPESDPESHPQVDVNLVTLAEGGLLPPSALTGVRFVDDLCLHVLDQRQRTLDELGLQFRAHGAAPVDLPICHGGVGAHNGNGHYGSSCDRCPERSHCGGLPDSLANRIDELRPLPGWMPLRPNRHIVILSPYGTERVLPSSTLPALAEALRCDGHTTELRSVWDVHWHPKTLGWRPPKSLVQRFTTQFRRRFLRAPPQEYTVPDGTTGDPLHVHLHGDEANSLSDQWLRDQDLSTADHVIVPGFRDGLRVFHHPTFPHHATLVVLDFHLLHHLDHWTQHYVPAGCKPTDGGWWPDERVRIVSCFPGYAHLYRSMGVPLRQISWRPYPLYRGHFAPGPDPSQATTIFAGGRHRRDFETLSRATRWLAGVRPIEVYHSPSDPIDEPSPLIDRGNATFIDFYRAIQNSRFVVVPLQGSTGYAAGITIIALALAAGRPIIATRSPGTVDHLRHDHDSLLVPNGDARALANAIRRLDADDHLLNRLADGARRAAARLSVQRLAHTLSSGTPAAPSVRSGGTWPAW